MKGNISTALDLAMDIEKDSIFRYLEIARKTKDTSGKNMFITLAMEEVKHLLILSEARQIVEEEVHLKPLEVPKSEIEGVLPDIIKREKKKHGKSELNELDALEIALEHEKKAMDFYEKKSVEMTDETLKNLFKRLYEMERGHYELIMAQLDYIKGTGFWFDMPEFSME
ncbi:MAG: ferritin family protein [candidate division WOR-3 bacterium]